jgi:NAD(P)-dependent dehydrogenase (short-subunit alcohol dehydrogenase family)
VSAGAGGWDGRSVLITGGSRGIGLASAALFVAGGAAVTITGRDPLRLMAAAGSLGAPNRVHGVVSDIASIDGCNQSVEEALGAFGRLDVVFANAGSYESQSTLEADEALWDRTIDTHLKGTFFTVKAALAALRESHGCVVTMASDAGLRGMAGGWAAYCAAMGGVVNLTRALAVELAPTVRVNAVAPGPVDTETLIESLADGSYGGAGAAGGAAGRPTMEATIPSRRMATASEVAQAVAYLASAEAVTGSVLSIDGGTSAALP